MKCLYCESKVFVRSTVANDTHVLRERVCKENGHIFYTKEFAPKAMKQWDIKGEIQSLRMAQRRASK